MPSSNPAPPPPIHFGREIDYLEDLGAKLRNLQGFATLAHELLQNADDVPGVTDFAFNILPNALVVENDGQFSDCGHPETPECAWKDGPTNGSHRCDFHRFRLVAGADKRNEAGTTGAFGIGFISVYQITDRPELISGRHWILDETQQPNQRITQCPGCEACRAPGLPATRFILPWASNPKSTLRQKLRAEPTTAETPAKLLSELERSLPTAMLFLKKLSKVEIREEGRLSRRLERVKQNDSILLTDGDPANDRVWHLVRGDFSAKAQELRQLHPRRIEPKRSAEVTIAIPVFQIDSGLLCATLPTQQQTGLPFHINADFYPSEDRKRIISEQDFQSAWNRAALDAAAGMLAGSLPKLQAWLGHQRLWSLLARLQQASAEAEVNRAEKVFGQFWAQLAPSLASAQVIYTQQEDWRKPSEVLYLQQESERAALPVLESIGLAFVHDDLRPHQNLFTSAPISVRTLSVPHVAEALKLKGLTEQFDRGAWPEFLQTRGALRSLWVELELLFNRRAGTSSTAARDAASLSALSLAVRRDGALCPCTSVYRASNLETERLFLHLDSAISFASAETNGFPLFSSLSPAFGPAQAIGVLQKLGPAGLGVAVQGGLVTIPALLSWFVDHRTAILESANLRPALAALSIYPSAGGFQPLTSLSLPGHFTDPLQLAALLDVTILPKHHDFLRELGIQELSFPVYVAQHLIPALQSPELPDQKRRDAVLLLASRRSEISEDQEIRQQLASLSLVECSDRSFHDASAVYFPSQVVSEVLGGTALQAALPAGHETVFTELFRWLGVAEHPRFADIEAHVKRLVSTPPNPASLASVRTVFAHLAARLHGDEATVALNNLKTLVWLPARQQPTRWFKPPELFAVFQDYLFESQASFLDIDRATQSNGSKLLTYLGIKSAPSATQVVAHLLHCAGNSAPVNQEIYRFLNENHQDATVAQLCYKRCLLLPDGTYASPASVFWSEHPFGRFRMQLGGDLRRYNDLFQRLGIRETPTHEDAFNVLGEISAAFGSVNKPLDDAAHAVVMACWRMLETALETSALTTAGLAERLAETKCVPNAARLLVLPTWMFFEDRAGLASKFEGFLTPNVIPRPLGASKAMAATGVRTLVSAVEIELLECQHPTESLLVTDRVRERRLQLARVLEAQSSGGNHEARLAEMDRMRFESAELLQIRYKLSAFDRTLTSRPENCPALFQAQSQLLIFVSCKDRPPWAPIARELALALYPDEEPGRIAPGLKDVLAADTVADAMDILDQLGFAIWEATAAAPTSDSATVTALGGETTTTGTTQPGGGGQAPDGGSIPSTSTAAPTLPQTLPAPPQAPPGTPPPGVGGFPDGGGGPATGGGTKTPCEATSTRGQRPPRRGRLRTYVIKDPTPSDGPPDTKGHQERSAVGAAGIAKVVEFERALGCDPKVMPHHNPGYDIESRDPASGTILRYIEVKSLSGLWGQDGVGLTTTEFLKAQEMGDLFWLYVVEHAQQPDGRIHCIQNPAGKVDQYFYDDGWQQAKVEDTRSMRPPEDW
jgi:hypothetical protein